ncbi:hypothetical protein HanPSC8_Chr17g0752011 [Helianthus annuus]|nr:hypothetical protein HanPSC8_Chr17g0752011 [Helianthus annuus]
MPVFNLVTESTLISQEGPSMTQKGYAEQNHLKLPSIVVLFLILDWVVPMLQPCLEIWEECVVKTSTFRNACRNVGIPEWPWIPSSTTNRASSDPESPITPTTSETSYFPTSIATESMPYIWNMGINNWSPVQTMITQAPFSEYLTNQIDCDTSPFGTLIATQYGSIGFPAETEYMASDPGSFGAPIYIDHMPDLSYLIPDWNVGSCESPYIYTKYDFH